MPLDPFSALLDSDIDVASPAVAPATGHGDKLNRALKILRAKLAGLPFVTDFSGVDPTGATSSTTAFLALAAGWYVVPPGTYAFATGGTLPANVKLFSIGGILAPASGQTLTLGSGGRYVHDGTGVGGAGTVAQGSGAIITPGGGATGTLVAANNLSDLANAATARTNLGLTSTATTALASLLLAANNLSELANAATARTNLGLANGTTGQFWAYNGAWARAGLLPTTVKTSAYTAAVLDLVRADTTAGAFTVTLPAVPADGDRVAVSDAATAGSWGTNALTVAPGASQSINNSASSVPYSSAGGEVVFTYRSSSANWSARVFTRGVGLQAANNLSDLASATTARTNLGLTSTATTALASLLLVANNLSDVASVSTARTNLGLTSTATTALASLLLAANNLSDLANAATARTNLGLTSTATTALASLVLAANNGSDFASANLTRNNIFKGTVALTDATTIATNCSLGNVFTVTLGGNRTLGAPTNLAAGAAYTWFVKQDGTGSRTLAYNAVFNFGTAGTPTLTTTAAKTDVISAWTPDGTNLYAAITKGF